MGTGTKEYNPPEWMTISFMEEIFRDYLKDGTIRIVDLLTKPLILNNNNCGVASNLHRCSFKIQTKDYVQSYSTIIKELPKGYSGLVAQKHKLFKREMLVYKEILPRIHNHLKQINENIKISPNCFYSTETPEPFLILEDMKLNEFEMFEKERLFSLNQAIPIIKKIAKFHACTAVIAEQNPGIMDFFEEGAISNNPERKDFLGFFPANFKCLAEQVAKWKGYEDICEKLYILEKNVLVNGIDLFKSNSNEFRVLNFGDLWINNIMLKLDENLVATDCILLDYQLAYFGSPAIDLNYFIYGSISENVRKVHFKFMIQEYYNHLKQTLVKLSYKGKIPTLKDIHIELIRKSLYAVISSTCLTPIIFGTGDELIESEVIAAIETDNDNCNLIKPEHIEHPKYKAFIQRTLKEFHLSGFLD